MGMLVELERGEKILLFGMRRGKFLTEIDKHRLYAEYCSTFVVQGHFSCFVSSQLFCPKYIYSDFMTNKMQDSLLVLVRVAGAVTFLF